MGITTLPDKDHFISAVLWPALLVIFLVIFLGCASSVSAPNSDQKQVGSPEYEKLATDKFESDFRCDLNKSRTLALCQKNYADSHRNNFFIDYFIFDIGKGQLILESRIHRSSISWSGNHQLKIFHIPGVMAEGQTREDFTEILDLKEKGILKP